MTPQGVITEFVTPTFSFPLGIAAGPDGNVWFTEGDGGQIGFITPKGRIAEIRFASSGLAAGIVTGPDGNIWFVDATGNKVWRLELPTRVLTSFPIPTPDSFPNDITVGGDGNLWFTESDRIGRITTDGVITEFGSGLGELFFTEFGSNRISSITTDGVVTESGIFRNALPTGIAPGTDRRIWFRLWFQSRLPDLVSPLSGVGT